MQQQETSLREQALEAYEDQREEEQRTKDAIERKEQKAQLEALQTRILNQFRLHVEPTEETITIDGLTFGVDNHYRLLQLHMPCKSCRKLTPFREIEKGLLGLGTALKEYEQPEAGICLCPGCQQRWDQAEWAAVGGSSPVLSTEEQIVHWLLILIRREIAAGAGHEK